MAGCGTGLIMCIYFCVLMGKNLDEIQGRFCLVKEDGIGPNDQKTSLLWKDDSRSRSCQPHKHQ